MAWVKIDDRFPQHPKVAAAGPLAMAMQVAGLCYCNRELTDGFIPRAIARTLLDWEVVRDDGTIYTIGVSSGMRGDDLDSPWVIDLLVDAGLWEAVPGGYRIHDYLDYQPSREETLKDRDATARRQADWRERKKSKRSHTVSNAVTNGVTNTDVQGKNAPYAADSGDGAGTNAAAETPKTADEAGKLGNSEQSPVSNGVTNGVTNGSVTGAPVPVPVVPSEPIRTTSVADANPPESRPAPATSSDTPTKKAKSERAPAGPSQELVTWWATYSGSGQPVVYGAAVSAAKKLLDGGLKPDEAPALFDYCAAFMDGVTLQKMLNQFDAWRASQAKPRLPSTPPPRLPRSRDIGLTNEQLDEMIARGS